MLRTIALCAAAVVTIVLAVVVLDLAGVVDSDQRWVGLAVAAATGLTGGAISEARRRSRG